MDNPFKKFFNEVSGALNNSTSFGGESALGIDIGSSAIKIVEIKKKGGKAVLETYGSIALGPYADLELGAVTNLPTEKLVEALKEVMHQSGSITKSIALSVSVQSSLVFVMDLPAQITNKELSAIVATEARKYIPVPINEVSLDFFEMPRKEMSFEEVNNPDMSAKQELKKEVLVVAIQNDAVAKLRSIVDQSKLKASFFEVEIFSSVRSCFEHELSLVLLVDVGASRTKLSFVEFGIIKYYHTIDRGSADITSSISKSLSIPFEKAEALKKEFGIFENNVEKELASIIKVHTDYIFSEINNVLLRYEKKNNRAVSKIIFTGGGCLLKGLKEEAINNFKVEIEISRPFAKVGAPKFLEKVLDTTGPEFAVATGLALRQLQ